MTYELILTEPPRERRRAKNLRRILDAAMTVIEDAGFEALTMNRLAAALDYTPGALYRYFPSRDALLVDLVLEIIADAGALLHAAGKQTLPPLARVVACATAWRHYAGSEPNRFGLLALMMATPRLVLTQDADATRAMAALLTALEPVRAALDEAVSVGLLPSGSSLERSVLIFAGLHGTLLLRKQAARAPALVDVDRLTTAMLHALLVGFGAAPPAVKEAFDAVESLRRSSR